LDEFLFNYCLNSAGPQRSALLLSCSLKIKERRQIMKTQLQEEVDKGIIIPPEFSDSQIGWEHPEGFLPKTEEPDSSPTQEPS